MWLLKIKSQFKNLFQDLFLNNFMIQAAKVVFMHQFDSDSDTNDSNADYFLNPQLESLFSAAINTFFQFQQKLKRIAFQKIIDSFLTNKLQKSEYYLKKAEHFYSQGNFQRSSQYASQAYLLSKNDCGIHFEKSLIILIQSKINNGELTEVQKLIQQISLIQQTYFTKRILFSKIKFYKLSKNWGKTLQCLEYTKQYFIQNQEYPQKQRNQAIIIYGQSYIDLNMINQAYIALQQWLPRIVEQKKQNCEIQSKIYLMMATIEKRKGNLDIEFSHLYCASSVILNKRELKDLHFKIQCQKIKNLINRQQFRTAVCGIQQIVKFSFEAKTKQIISAFTLQIRQKLMIATPQINNNTKDFLLRKLQRLTNEKQFPYGNTSRNSIFCL